ncbi:MAG TPA: hypothetical protein VOA64_03145 [Candidatus Dormibacteraeota bacterium]|nr:hypothetical protein [Candidatus Dormibacteraeota bacterium]
MNSGPFLGERSISRCALAVLCCAALLYFAAGGWFLHQHGKGPDTICHVCQVLHMPAVAIASFAFFSAPEIVTQYLSAWHSSSGNDPLSLHRAGRAPPAA